MASFLWLTLYILYLHVMMMMMMSGFVERVINNPQVDLQMSSERQRGKSCGYWQTVPDHWACDRETPHPQRSLTVLIFVVHEPY